MSRPEAWSTGLQGTHSTDVSNVRFIVGCVWYARPGPLQHKGLQTIADSPKIRAEHPAGAVKDFIRAEGG
ncbi:hypothetical protein CSC81_17070, partial [Tenacibaculum discolor]